MDQFISKATLGQSLKQISPRATPLEVILDDIARYRSSHIDIFVQENLIVSRYKNKDSIIRKYERALQAGGGFKQCFNDVLGLRLRFRSKFSYGAGKTSFSISGAIGTYANTKP